MAAFEVNNEAEMLGIDYLMAAKNALQVGKGLITSIKGAVQKKKKPAAPASGAPSPAAAQAAKGAPGAAGGHKAIIIGGIGAAAVAAFLLMRKRGRR